MTPVEIGDAESITALIDASLESMMDLADLERTDALVGVLIPLLSTLLAVNFNILQHLEDGR